MFLHRAFTTSSRDLGKIHCLAFADSLDYDVGEQAEKVLKEFMNTSSMTVFANWFMCLNLNASNEISFWIQTSNIS